SISSDSQKLVDRPKTAVQMPYRMTASSRIGPWRRNGPHTDSSALAATAPTDGAAYSSPTSSEQTFKISVANNGSSTVAEPSRVARKSSSIVLQISVFLRTNAKPSNAARKLTARRSPITAPMRITSSATITATNETASIQ